MMTSVKFLFYVIFLIVICYSSYHIYRVNYSPYYSVENLKDKCCYWFPFVSMCQVSGSCYNYFKHWNPIFDKILEKYQPFGVATAGGPMMYYLSWNFVNPLNNFDNNFDNEWSWYIY